MENKPTPPPGREYKGEKLTNQKEIDNWHRCEQVLYNVCMNKLLKMEKPAEYYTPSIEDIRVGYECEFYEMTMNSFIQSASSSKWVKVIVDKDSIWEILNSDVRTPYLTKEQIEAEGWIRFPQELNTNPYFYYQKGDRYLSFQSKTYDIEIHNDGDYDNHDTYYQGKCKSINELRYICKLLNIK